VRVVLGGRTSVSIPVEYFYSKLAPSHPQIQGGRKSSSADVWRPKGISRELLSGSGNVTESSPEEEGAPVKKDDPTLQMAPDIGNEGETSLGVNSSPISTPAFEELGNVAETSFEVEDIPSLSSNVPGSIMGIPLSESVYRALGVLDGEFPPLHISLSAKSPQRRQTRASKRAAWGDPDSKEHLPKVESC
ncbi:hypothetical protein LINPERHAP1_LOCUS9458, partial [Linum perenne]